MTSYPQQKLMTDILNLTGFIVRDYRFISEIGIVLSSLADWLKNAQEYFPESSGTIRRWLGEIIAYFDNRTTQGVVEGINNKLKLIKRRGYGFRNFYNFSLRCFLIWLVPISFAS